MFDFKEFTELFWEDERFSSNYELAEWCRNHVPDLIQYAKKLEKQLEERLELPSAD